MKPRTTDSNLSGSDTAAGDAAPAHATTADPTTVDAAPNEVATAAAADADDDAVAVEAIAEETKSYPLEQEIGTVTQVPEENPLLRRIGLRRVGGLFLKAGKRGFWPLVDQGVVSVGNIAIVILVARGLTQKEDFGTYNLVMEVLFFLISMHAAVVTYPLTVQGAVAETPKLRHLTTASLLLTALLALPVTCVGLALSKPFGLAGLALAAAVALLLRQMQETVRRGLMSHFRYAEALWGDAVTYAGQAAALYVLWRLDRLTLGVAFGTMAAASAAGLLIQVAQVGVSPVTRGEFVGVCKSFLGSGRWMALTNLGTLCLLVCGSWPLTYFHGRARTADFFAIAALLKVCNPIIQSVGGMIVPAAAKALDRGGMRAAARISLKMAGMAGLVMTPFLACLLLFPGISLSLAFHGKYAGPESEGALRLFAFSYVGVYLTTMVTSFLNGVHRTRYTFYGQVVGSICMFVILLPLNILIPVKGFIWGGIIQLTIQLIALAILTRRTLRETHTPTHQPTPAAPAAPAAPATT